MFPRLALGQRFAAVLREVSRSGIKLELDDTHNLAPASVVRVEIEVDGQAAEFFGQVQWRASASQARRSSWGLKCLASPARGHRAFQNLVMEQLRAAKRECVREHDARAPLLTEREDQFLRSARALDPGFDRVYDSFLDSLANDGDVAVMWTNALESPSVKPDALLERWRLLSALATESDVGALATIRARLDACCREVLTGPSPGRQTVQRCFRFMDLRLFQRFHAPHLALSELAQLLDGWRSSSDLESLSLRGSLAGRNGVCFLTPDLDQLPADEDECALTLLRLGIPEQWMNVQSGCVGIGVDAPRRLRKPVADDGLNGLFRPELGCGFHGYARNLDQGAPALRELVGDPVPVARIFDLRAYWKARTW